MNTLLYEPAEGDPYRVIAPQFPFCYPPTVHQFSDWSPKDDWREGHGNNLWAVEGDRAVTMRKALVLIWKGEFLPDSYHRLYDVMSKIEQREWKTVDGWKIRYPDMGLLDVNWGDAFLTSMCVRENPPEWVADATHAQSAQVRAWYLGRGALRCLHGNLIEWEAP